jgi:membrane protease YdiL (CAAX protease family)
MGEEKEAEPDSSSATEEVETQTLADTPVDFQTLMKHAGSEFRSFGSQMSGFGTQISGFSLNSPGYHKVRVWLFVVLTTLTVWAILWVLLTSVFSVWMMIIGIPPDWSFELAYIFAAIISFYPITRVYSYCTNNRDFSITSDILTDYDPFVVRHLFQLPKGSSSFSLTMKALLVDFVGGWAILLIFLFGYGMNPGDVAASAVDLQPMLLFSIISLAIAAPVIEELLFRGLVQDFFGEIYPKWIAIFFTAAIFGLIHLNPFSIINAFWGGMVYGYVRYETGSLWPSIFLHSMWNLHIIVLFA